MIKYAVSVVVSVALVFSLCACSAEREFVLGGFSSEVSFTMDEIWIKGELNFKDRDNITLRIIEPSNLSDITFTANSIIKDDLTINYSKFKDDSPVYVLLSVVADLSERQINLPCEGEFDFSSKTSSTGYKVIFDCAEDKIIRIWTEKFTYNFK